MSILKAFLVIFFFSLGINSLTAAELKFGMLKVGAAKEGMNPPDAMLVRDNGVRRFSGIHDSLYVRSIA